jgi:hypothetical protein
VGGNRKEGDERRDKEHVGRERGGWGESMNHSKLNVYPLD